jgi:uncharacterized Zn finger protein (UPF0148 family)
VSFLQANCPSCAAPIEFKSGSSIVIVCPFCRSAVARTDRALEDLGKVAEIMQSESPLRVGLHGMWNNQRFELTGRAQIRHQLGGFWDEWYATFGNGWVGWLAEAQGKFYLTFYQPLPEGAQLPSFTDLQLGQALPQIPSPNPLMVAEKGVATSVAAEGEIPYKLVPNEQSEYADLAGKDKTFGTIDYGMNPPFVFVGKELTLAELGWADLKPAERTAPRVSAAAMGCPNCGGPINLQVPDKSERVTCPNCDSLLSCEQGKLAWMKSLAPSPDEHKFDLQIGAEGTFGDKKMRIIGAVVRSVTIEGIKYFWHEYLLYNPAVGFRWLVHSDNHWNFVEPINVADVTGEGTQATFDGKTFKIFQDANAVVEYVKGEFYWRVEQGETVRAIDYIKPPLMLSNEMTSDEMNFSLGTYMKPEEVEKALNLESGSLPRPWNVAPNQPFEGSFWYTWGFLFLIGLLVIGVVMLPLKMESTALPPTSITLPPLPAEKGSNPVFTQPFELKPRGNVEISIKAPVTNSWASFDVDFINEANNDVESVPLDVEFYSGVEDGESWSEGSQEKSTSFSAIEGGKYRLRIDGQWQNWQQPLPITVTIKQNTTGCNFCCAFILLLFGPLWGLIKKWSFEGSRWSQSMFTSSGTANTGDSDSSDSCSSCSSD